MFLARPYTLINPKNNTGSSSLIKETPQQSFPYYSDDAINDVTVVGKTCVNSERCREGSEHCTELHRGRFILRDGREPRVMRGQSRRTYVSLAMPSPRISWHIHRPLSTTHTLVPKIGETNLLLNSDIVIPLSAYFSDTFGDGDYSNANTESKSWREKTTGAVWRGVASGGRNKAENWASFHRQCSYS